MNDTRTAIRNGEINPVKSLGQNFITDENIARRIVEAAKLTPDDHVIEVGPGVCALTGFLCDAAGSVTAVEIDRRLADRITAIMAGRDNFRLVVSDILKTNPAMLLPQDTREPDRAHVKLVSNIPYYISTPLMMFFFKTHPIIGGAVLTMQKEVAERLTAKPGSTAYGALTVAANFYAATTRLFTIPPHCFTPQPSVESTVVALAAHKTPPVDPSDRELFFSVVNAAFAQRRKTLENNLIGAGLAPGREQAAQALADAGIPPDARGEALGVEAFAALTTSLSRLFPAIP